jgi:hypothetical protein
MKENKSIDATSDLLDFLCDEENQEELRRMKGEQIQTINMLKKAEQANNALQRKFELQSVLAVTTIFCLIALSVYLWGFKTILFCLIVVFLVWFFGYTM